MSNKPTDLYTVDGLAWLQGELARKRAQWEAYTGNNPKWGAADRKDLGRQIRVVTDALKAEGLIPLTEAEILKRELDRQTPDRRRGCCTLLASQWYRITYTIKDEGGFWQWEWRPITSEQTRDCGSYVHPNVTAPMQA